MPAKRWLVIATVLALQILVIHGWAQGDELSQQVELSDNFVLWLNSRKSEKGWVK